MMACVITDKVPRANNKVVNLTVFFVNILKESGVLRETAGFNLKMSKKKDLGDLIENIPYCYL